ncbi:MAG: hypothetical protein M3R60_11005 [Pseudomonadota bacterium]|nr:hypothetical protein [Pseudomonadota bacterium]
MSWQAPHAAVRHGDKFGAATRWPHCRKLAADLQHFIASGISISPVATELNIEKCQKSNIFHVEIIYITIISFAIFDGNLKHSGDKQ